MKHRKAQATAKYLGGVKGKGPNPEAAKPTPRVNDDQKIAKTKPAQASRTRANTVHDPRVY